MTVKLAGVAVGSDERCQDFLELSERRTCGAKAVNFAGQLFGQLDVKLGRSVFQPRDEARWIVWATDFDEHGLNSLGITVPAGAWLCVFHRGNL